MRRDSDPSLWKGVAAGLAAGLVASWIMNEFQSAWTRETEGFEKPHGAQSGQPSDGEQSTESSTQKANSDDATIKTAELISENVLGRELQDHQKRSAGAAVHYVFGTATGGIYGALAEFAPAVSKAAGVPFGAIFWVLADETVVPLLGLSKGPSGYRFATHVYSFSSHLVYGVSAELSRRLIRRAL